MNDMPGARTRAAWARASDTAADLHAEFGSSVPLTYFVVWLAGGFVIALFIGWLTAPFALWRAAGGTLQIFGVILVALHLMRHKRENRQSRFRQLATELRMLWSNVVSQPGATEPKAAAPQTATEIGAALRERIIEIEAELLAMRKELDDQYVGPLAGLKSTRPNLEKMSADHATAAARATRIQLEWVGLGWILTGIVLATWS